MKKLLLLLPLCALSGCTYLSAVGTQFKKMEEPQDGERARIRVVGNYVAMRGTPGSSCMDYRKKGAGTVIGGFIGSTGYRGRSLVRRFLNVHKTGFICAYPASPSVI